MGKQARDKRQEEWEAHDNEERLKYETRKQRRAERQGEWECSSQSTVSTAMTATLMPEDEEAVRCKVEADKDVRRLAKKLREMDKLEACNNLNPMQKAKLEKKWDVEVELDTARGLARARARNELFVSRGEPGGQ